MNPAFRKYLDAATGLTALTAQRAERIAKGLVKSGEAAGDQVGDLVDDLLERSKKNREALTALVRNETSRAVHAAGLATSTEVERLQKQVADLKREVSRLEREAGGGSARTTRKKTAKKAGKRTAKKAGKKTAKKAAKKTAKKSAAKKSAAKKTTGSS